MPLHASPTYYRRLTAKPRIVEPYLMNASFSFLKDITALTGGTSAALDSVNTQRLTLPYFAKVRITLGDGSKAMQGWIARTRASEAESSGALEDFKYVVPDNWHATENNVIWERVE